MMNPLTLFLRTMIARAYPRIVVSFREPTWLVQETVLPIMSVSAYAFVYKSFGAESLVNFVFLGGVLTAYWINVLWGMASQFYWERNAGNLELFVLAPAPLMAILAGMTLGGIILTSVRAAVILLAGILFFDFALTPSSWPLLIGLFFLTLLALYGLGMVFASLFLMWGREAWHMVAMLQEPVYLFAGLNFPVRVMGGFVTAVAMGLPLALGVDALRQVGLHAVENRLLPVEWEIAILAGQVVLFLGLAQWMLKFLERRARDHGQLSLRGD